MIDYDCSGDRVYVVLIVVEYHVADVLVVGKHFGLDGRTRWYGVR
jgi:hypothetical protein